MQNRAKEEFSLVKVMQKSGSIFLMNTYTSHEGRTTEERLQRKDGVHRKSCRTFINLCRVEDVGYRQIKQESVVSN